ncbi:hypothetical protein [Lysobacter xanthus]
MQANMIFQHAQNDAAAMAQLFASSNQRDDVQSVTSAPIRRG